MKKQHNLTVINWNLPICDNLQFIKDHVCFLVSYHIYDINYTLLDIKNQLHIRTFKYNCNKAMLDIIKSDSYIQLNYFILKLPIYFHNRNLCLIQKNTEDNIGLTNIGILHDNYLIQFKDLIKYQDLINKRYNDILEHIIKSHVLLYQLA